MQGISLAFIFRHVCKQIDVSLLTMVVQLQIVYVARNPKDVAVSWYKLNQAFKTQGYEGDFPKFWHYFKNDLSKLENVQN